jgi:hypothetical protein
MEGGRVNGDEEWMEQVLEAQLAMNSDAWEQLRQHGVTEDTDLRLEFFYIAADEQAAQGLAAFLQAETEYEVTVGSSTSGGLMRRTTEWKVSGVTHETNVNQEILDEWVAWMVVTGFENDCQFDGWGAALA